MIKGGDNGDNGGRGETRPLEGAVKSAGMGRKGMTIVLRLRNPGGRALHYIGAPRALIYDPATRRLTVRLSDKGRTPIPGGLYLLPAFKVIDPHSEAEVAIDVPPTIVKLADGPAPPGDIRLEEHDLSQAEAVQVEVAWSDTPFYQDPRTDDHDVPAASRWQKGELTLTHQLRPKGTPAA